MISEQEQAQIRLLSDNELYPQAIEFMKSVGKALPSTQVNGLLNVSLADTYNNLKTFTKKQSERKTWGRDEHIPKFYRDLGLKLTKLEAHVPSIIKLRREKASKEDETALKMAIAREFIQHILAENAYKDAMGGFAPANNDKDQRKPDTREGHR